MNNNRQNIIKWLIISMSSFLFLAFFVFIIIQAKQAKNNAQKVQFDITSSDHIRGNKSAKLTLIEFSDFQCPACAQIEPLTEQLLKDYPKDLRIIYKYFPLPGHPNSIPSAKAAEAADRQGKFWEMHDILFKRQNEWSSLEKPQDIFKIYAHSLKLNEEQFAKDIDSKKVADRINSDLNLAISLNIEATPTFFLNGEKLTITGYQDFKNAVDQKLKQ